MLQALMSPRPRFLPWTDRTGRFSPLKASVFVALFAPALVTAYLLFTGDFRAEPAKGVNHELGLWAFRLILLSLCVTPAIQILRWPRLIVVRRLIGVGAYAYAFAHLIAYAAMENFNLVKVASEIAVRFYLTIGFAALLILSALAATSFDSAVKRLGARAWGRLQRLNYVAATLAVIHYFIQSKLVVFEPTVFAGVFLWLMGYRLIAWLARPRLAMHPAMLVGLAIAATALTMIGEAAGYMVFTPVDGMKVFMANFTFVAGIRPGWYVAMAAAAVSLIALARNGFVHASVP